MEIDQIMTVSLDNPKSILALPFPEFTEIETASPNDLRKVCHKFLKLWKTLIIDKAKIKIDEYELPPNQSGDTEILEGEELWQYLFMLIAGYYDYSLQKYLEKGSEVKLPPGFTVEALKKFIPSDEIRKDQEKIHMKYVVLRIMSHHYFTMYFSLYFINLLTVLALPAFMIGEYERQFINHMAGMFDIVGKLKTKYLQVLASELFGSVLEYATFVYEKKTSQNIKHMPGPFSAIRLSDLSLLASRDDIVCSRYGDTKIARVFENQLALIAQSFGLYVVSTRVGLNTVDLVCISSQPDERISFIIEAKTSKRAYYLPKKDARALKEYVSDLRSSLSSLPPLSFVMILGPDPSSTLHSTLQELEASVGIPVRYMRAQLFANLREFILGPLPLRIFKQLILTSAHILPEEIITSVVDAYRLEQEAHSTFLEAMISAKGISTRLSNSMVRN